MKKKKQVRILAYIASFKNASGRYDVKWSCYCGSNTIHNTMKTGKAPMYWDGHSSLCRNCDVDFKYRFVHSYQRNIF